MWSFLFFGVVFVLAGIVRSTGAVVPPLIILGIALWGIRVPFAKLLQPVLGVDAIWWSFPVSAACAMAMQLAYYRWGRAQCAHAPGCGDGAIPSEVKAGAVRRWPEPRAEGNGSRLNAYGARRGGIPSRLRWRLAYGNTTSLVMSLPGRQDACAG